MIQVNDMSDNLALPFQVFTDSVTFLMCMTNSTCNLNFIHVCHTVKDKDRSKRDGCNLDKDEMDIVSFTYGHVQTWTKIFSANWYKLLAKLLYLIIQSQTKS